MDKIRLSECTHVYRTSKIFKFEREANIYYIGRKDKAVKLEFFSQKFVHGEILVGLGWNHKVPYPSTSSVTQRGISEILQY